MTGWEPELAPNTPAGEGSPYVCRAIALALKPSGSGGAHKLQLSIEAAAQPSPPFRSAGPTVPASRMQVLAAILNDQHYAAAHWPLPGGGLLAWRRGTEGRDG
jgi:hypothetical protein